VAALVEELFARIAAPARSPSHGDTLAAAMASADLDSPTAAVVVCSCP
jgi:hypothetical protein